MSLLENGDDYSQEFQKIKHLLTEEEIIAVANAREKKCEMILSKKGERLWLDIYLL